MNDEEKQAFDNKKVEDCVNENSVFLIKDTRLMQPELKIKQRIVSEGKTKSTSGKPPPKKVFSDLDLQTWLYSKDGYIYNKQLNSLVLTVVPEQSVSLSWSPGKSQSTKILEGFSVQLRGKAAQQSPDQIWNFTTDGFIVSERYPDYPLTSTATILPSDDDNFVAMGTRMNDDDLFVSFAAVCPKCETNSPFIHRQRYRGRERGTMI